MSKNGKEHIAVIGLGYVGLPVAVALGRAFANVTGFDISKERIEALNRGEDATREVAKSDLLTPTVTFSSDPEAISGATIFIVTVPTPVTGDKRPDFTPLKAACELIGPHLTPGSVVLFESTVFPGATEEVCGLILVENAAIKRDEFKLAYSPERINPGDGAHGLENNVKVVAAEDAATLARVAAIYEAIVPAGVHRAPSIMVAEAAKVIENTQRDINIALMNELAIIFDRLGIRTRDVLEAAGTKWNFLKFSPGLVGGHCIGVDPYYLTFKAEAVGHHPEVILAGRRINDEMGAFIGGKIVKLLIECGHMPKNAKVGIFGLTFKEDVPDLRNSKVVDVISELREFGLSSLVHDPLADRREALELYGVELADYSDMDNLDAAVIAVAHGAYRDNIPSLLEKINAGGVLVDIKSICDPSKLGKEITYWSL
ncbi:MAG: nucleotide sugar dehydrogenase [Hyphomicrobiales bacterium]